MSYSNTIVSLFKIAGCFVRDVQISTEGILVSVKKRRKTGTCPLCGKRTKRIHQSYTRKVLHTIVGIHKVFLLVKRRRFLCLRCKRVFMEDIPFLLGKKRHTRQLAESIVSRLRKESFRSTTEAVGVSYHGLRDCLVTVVDPFLPNWKKEERNKPFSLGIDEHYARRNRYVLSVTNLTERRPITFLPSNSVGVLKHFISKIPDEIKKQIKEVCCDMDGGYIHAVETELPKAVIVIDHFHLIQDANRRLNEARKIEQDINKYRMNWKVFTRNEEHLDGDEQRLLQNYCRRFPVLHCFYRVKEDLRGMYRLKTREEAEKRLREIRTRMSAMDIIELKLWAGSLRRHEQYILNFFNNRTTNAYTEGIHVKCKLIQRISFGFRNIDVYIRKAMLAFLPLTILGNYHRY
jgi:transposase